jgi:hypothetical protein
MCRTWVKGCEEENQPTEAARAAKGRGLADRRRLARAAVTGRGQGRRLGTMAQRRDFVWAARSGYASATRSEANSCARRSGKGFRSFRRQCLWV